MSLIVKQRVIPQSITRREALKGRIVSKHEKIPLILEHLRKEWAGYYGEKALDYPLSMLDNENLLIFHGLRLKVRGIAFQIDTLLLSGKLGFILEAKNWTGEVHFSDNPKQVTLTNEYGHNGIKDPVAQVKIQRDKLISWLAENNLPAIPIECLCVFTNPKTIIKIDNGYKDVARYMVKVDHFYSKALQTQSLYKTPVATPKELQKTKRKLLSKHEPLQIDILQFYKISKEEILSGVKCPECNLISMTYIWGSWHCKHCLTKTKGAHIAAIKDYSLLIARTIANKQFRAFLNLDSASSASKLLPSLNLPYSGTRKSRVYQLPHEE